MAMKAWVETMRSKGRIEGYRVRYSDASGRRCSEPGVFEKWHDAEALKKVVEDRLFNQRLGRVDPGLLTAKLVDQWLLECRSGNANPQGKPLRPSTVVTYQFSLARLIKKAPKIALCDEACFKALKDEMIEEDLMPWTVAGKLKDMRTFMRWCRRTKIITTDPFENVGISTPPSLPRYFTNEEIAALDQAAVGDPFHLAYWLALKCGLRRSEVLRADKRDIRWFEDGSGELLIWADVAKNGSYRNVPIAPCVMALVGSRGSGLLYPGMGPSAFEYAWAKLKAKAKISERPSYRYKTYVWARFEQNAGEQEQARFHDLRHTFCRIFLESKAGDIQTLSRITGHKSLDVLNRVYSHFDIGMLHQAMQKMESTPKFVGRGWEKIINIRGETKDINGQAGTTLDEEPKQERGEM